MPRLGGGHKDGWVKLLRENFEGREFTTAEAMEVLCETKLWSFSPKSLSQKIRLRKQDFELAGRVYMESPYSGYGLVNVWRVKNFS